MKLLLSIVFIIVSFSCVKNKNYNQNTNFDVLKFITNYKFQSNIKDSLLIQKIRDTLNISDKEWYIVEKYARIFDTKNNYLIVIDQFKGKSYYWFKKTDIGFESFYNREIADPLFIKDTIFDINNDGNKELIITNKTTGPNVSTIYFINENGLIDKNLKIIASFTKIDNDKFIQVSNHSSPIVSFSKCKWNKTNIDTIENLFYDYNKNSKFYIAKQYPFIIKDNEYVIDNSIELTTINKLPNEYQEALKKYDFKLYQNLKKDIK